MSEQLMFENSLNVTGSLALVAGQQPCDLPGGLTAKGFGLDLAHASHSVAPAKEKVKQTQDTSGQCSESLSASQKLTCALANRLKARLAVYGSPEYKLTWKEWVLQSGLRICAQRARAHQIYDKDYSGWPTPNAMEGGQTSRGGDRKGEKLMGGLAKLCGWPTPQVCQGPNNGENRGKNWGGKRPRKTPQNVEAIMSGWRTPTQGDAQRGVEQNPKERNSKAGTASLNNEAAMSGWPSPRGNSSTGKREHGDGGADLQTAAGWATPKPRDSKSESATQENIEKQWAHPRGKDLNKQATFLLAAGWATPAAMSFAESHQPGQDRLAVSLKKVLASGQISNGTNASTGNKDGYLLNPKFSLWLNGFPAEWLHSEVLETLSIRRLPPSSSKPTAKSLASSEPNR